MRIALAPLALILVGVVFGTAACDGEKDIVHGLDEFEANEILVVLEAKGISGDKLKEEGRVVAYSVVVPQSDSRDAMRILVANKLPRHRPQGLQEVYPAGGGGLIPTKSEEKARFLMAIQGEIERKLQRMPGIAQAHVSVVIPDKDVVRDLDTPPPPATASVAIVYNANDERGTSLVSPDEVKALVSASVEDLKPQNVQVVMKRNEPSKLVDVAAEGAGVGAPITAQQPFGIRVVDNSSATKVKLVAGILLVVTILGIGFGVGALLRALSLQKRLARADAELAAVRKAGRATQTNMQPSSSTPA